MQNKGYYAVQCNSKSSRSVPIRKPVCDFLLVINNNWHSISYRSAVIGAYSSNFGHFAFLSRLWRLLGTTCDVHLGLIGKRVVDLLTELFSPGVTAESLRAKIDRKSISLPRDQFDPKFQLEVVGPAPIIFARIVRPMNAVRVQLCRSQFSHKETL